MIVARVAQICQKLERNGEFVIRFFGKYAGDDWERIVYAEPYPWNVRDVLAHLGSAEAALLQFSKFIQAQSKARMLDFDYDAFNKEEQSRLQGVAANDLVELFRKSRGDTVEWVAGIDEAELAYRGKHPALGEVTLEENLKAMIGHTLLHLHDL